jgi:hypothetical protein
MSEWFGDVSDADDDEVEESESSVDQSESEDEYEGFAKWKRDENEAVKTTDIAEASRQVLSKEEKVDRAVCDACDQFDFVDFDNPAEWEKCLTLFKDVTDAVGKFYTKFQKVPEAFSQLLETLKAAIDEKKDSFESAKEKSFFTQFQKEVLAKAEKYAEAISRASAEPAEQGEEKEDRSKDQTREGMIAFLDSASYDSKALLRCKIMIFAAKREKWNDLLIALAAHACACQLESANATGPSSDQWRAAYRYLETSITTWDANPSIGISETGKANFDDRMRNTVIRNGWSSLAQQLHSAFTKGCRHDDYTPTAERVYDEALAASMADRCLAYYEKLNKKSGIATCSSVLLDILHVRTERAHELLNSRVAKFTYLNQPVADAVDKLASTVNALCSDALSKSMGTLAHVYHIALRDEFHRARDLFLAANVQFDLITGSPSLLVRFNRTVAQIGLCAFRTGMFGDALSILGDLCSKNPRDLRELLGQADLIRAPRRYTDEDIEKTAFERTRLVPPHHALPVQVLEHGHLVLSMMNDMIVEAKNPEDRPQRSKAFFNLCKRRQNAHFSGPAIDDNDRIYGAYEALLAGDVKTAIDHVSRITSWQQLPADCAALELLKEKLRIDGLKVFLISKGQHYASLTIGELSKRFGLSDDDVKATVSRLLLDHTLVGHWDEHDTHVVIERGPQSRFHMLAREACDRVAHFASFNENPNAATVSGGRGRGNAGSWGAAGRGGRGRGRGHN